jgi:hypothetical protein
MSSAMMKNRNLGYDTERSADQVQLVWKGAILFLCAGIFALMIWSGMHENRDPCFSSHAASSEVCTVEPKPEAPLSPAKGALAPLHSGLTSHTPD